VLRVGRIVGAGRDWTVVDTGIVRLEDRRAAVVDMMVCIEAAIDIEEVVVGMEQGSRQVAVMGRCLLEEEACNMRLLPLFLGECIGGCWE
jgi:hypothetical protein